MGRWRKADPALHFVIHLRLAGFYKSQAMVKPCRTISFSHRQSQGLSSSGGLGQQRSQQSCPHTGISTFGQQRDIHKPELSFGAVNDHPADVPPVKLHDEEVRLRERPAAAFMGLELHLEKCVSHFRRPAPRIQFFLSGAGIQFKAKRFVLPCLDPQRYFPEINGHIHAQKAKFRAMCIHQV